MASPIEILFLAAWNAGIDRFTGQQSCPKGLKDCFANARELCSPHPVVQVTLDIHKVLLARIIARKASTPGDIEALVEMGKDLVKLIVDSSAMKPSQ